MNCYRSKVGLARTALPVLLFAGLAALPGSAHAAVILDPADDFLPTFSGPHDPGFDVVAHEVTLSGDRMVFFGRMAGPVAPTQALGGLYLFGVDRGLGTPRFLGGTPIIGPNVMWDSVVRVNPSGDGQLFRGLIFRRIGAAGGFAEVRKDDVRLQILGGFHECLHKVAHRWRGDIRQPRRALRHQ